jgi:hypothetical protein
LDQPRVLHVLPGVENRIPTPIRQALTLLVEDRLPEYHAALPSQRSFLDLLDELQRAHADFIVTGRKLDVALSQRVRLHNAARDSIAVNDLSVVKFFFGRIHNVPDPQLLAAIDMQPVALTWLDEAYEVAAADPQVQEALPAYLAAEERLHAAADVLKNAL